MSNRKQQTPVMAPVTKLEEWCQNPQLVAWANKLFSTPEWRLLCQIMQEGEHPRFYDDAPGFDPNRKLGRIEGWDLYNSRLRFAAELMQVQGPMPEATFEDPERESVPKEKE